MRDVCDLLRATAADVALRDAVLYVELTEQHGLAGYHVDVFTGQEAAELICRLVDELRERFAHDLDAWASFNWFALVMATMPEAKVVAMFARAASQPSRVGVGGPSRLFGADDEMIKAACAAAFLLRTI